MKTATTGWTVVTATGAQHSFASLKQANRVARELRRGTTQGRKHAKPLECEVVAR